MHSHKPSSKGEDNFANNCKLLPAVVKFVPLHGVKSQTFSLALCGSEAMEVKVEEVKEEKEEKKEKKTKKKSKSSIL